MSKAAPICPVWKNESNRRWWRLQRALGALAARRSDDWRQTRCLFVLSCGRVGTDTLARLLGASADVCAFHEPRPQLLELRNDARVNVYREPRRFREQFIRARAASLAAAGLRRAAYAETSARLTFLAPVIADLLPNARFIVLHRHPGDVVRSGMRRGWYNGHSLDRHRICPVEGERHFREWPQWDQFRKICWYWAAYYRFITDFVHQAGTERCLMMRSEALFTGDPGTIESAFRLIGLDAPHPDVVRSVLDRRYNAQQQGEYPQFGQWTADQRAILHELAGDVMTRLGYEPQPEPAPRT